MIYLAAIFALALFTVRYLTAPRVYAVHASAVKKLPDGVRAETRYPPRITRTPDGAFFDMDHRFVGHAVGNSMSSYELPDGTRFVGDLLSDETKRSLPHGALVVVEVLPGSSDLCLRAVNAVDANGSVSFLEDSYGTSHPSLSLDQVLARATHALKPADAPPFPRWIDKLVRRPAA